MTQSDQQQEARRPSGKRGKPDETYEPPKLTKFEKLEKLIVSGE